MPSISSFFRHQRLYLNKTVNTVWKQEQQVLIDEIRQTGAKLALAGDSRCDSMGFR